MTVPTLSPASLSRTAVFEPGRVPTTRAVSNVRTTTVRRIPVPAEQTQPRRLSGALLGGVFGAAMGLVLLVFGPAVDEAPQAPDNAGVVHSQAR